MQLRNWWVVAGLSAAGAIHAQPVINLTDAPQVDDVFPLISVGHVPIAGTGEDVVWDLSALAVGTPVNFPCESPDATAYGDQYPTATLALDGGNNITYMRTDESGLYTVGVYKDLGSLSIQVHFTDEQLFLPYPCTYGTAFSDPYAYTYTYPGGTVNGTGHGSYVADGFGTLILPYDTIHNVLKLTGTDTVAESIPGTAYVTAVQQVYFYKPGIHYFVLSATQLSQSVNGGPPQQSAGISYMGPAMFAGIKGKGNQPIGVEAWPNPARDFVNVSYGIAGGRKVQLELFDGLGRSVRMVRNMANVPGIQQARMDVQGLPAGVYLLRVADDHGQRGSCRVVVQ
ncbi:MAG: T9SS type A sorting domain-containing protein [Bacteroidetes bacterium]|nr:T9SS type A sorting domain-containing protein [Bacteroidota bacterium]